MSGLGDELDYLDLIISKILHRNPPVIAPAEKNSSVIQAALSGNLFQLTGPSSSSTSDPPR